MTADMERSAVRLLISGRVQGVGYRWWAIREARRLGVDGWVRNLSDGGVEILAIGPEAAVAGLIEACRAGPPGAVVTAIECATAVDDGSESFGERETHYED